MKMTLSELLANGRIRTHTTSSQEIADLFQIVERDIADVGITQVSADRRFATAYNAALQLATIVLHAAGYRTARQGHHRTTFLVLPEIIGSEMEDRAYYFDTCRRKRNATDYDRAGGISVAEVEEIFTAVKAFNYDILTWLAQTRPELLPEDKS